MRHREHQSDGAMQKRRQFLGSMQDVSAGNSRRKIERWPIQLPHKTLLRYAFLALLLLGISIHIINSIAARNNDDVLSSATLDNDKQSLFYFVQVNDPQFGVENAYGASFEKAMDWSKEEGLFRMALEHVVRLNPKFAVIGGDMQQYYPRNEGSNGIVSNYTEAGPNQVRDVKAIINDTLVKANIPVQILPGNHDVDDAPDITSLNYYSNQWESYSRYIGGDGFSAYVGRDEIKPEVPGQYYHFNVEGIIFIVLNSQLYFDDSNLLDSSKHKQTEWFESIINGIQGESSSTVKNVVILTHIPPFGASPEEDHGWSNWRIKDRNTIMNIAYSATKNASSNVGTIIYPSLWLCGHFHGNAQYIGPVDGIPDGVIVEVVVTNSVTYPMEWDGVPANEPFSYNTWMNVATIPSAEVAFKKFIVPDATRIAGGSSKAGLRVIEFLKDGSYRHKYFTLDEIAAVQSIDDESMAGSSFRSPLWNNNARSKTTYNNAIFNDDNLR